MATSITENLQDIRNRIAEAARRAGRSPEEVRLVAVSKKQPASAVMEAYRAGQRLFGENYIQEALGKMEQTGAGPVWHMIGHLQSNKARYVPGRFQAVQTVDSPHLAHALNRHAQQAGVQLDVFVQLNLDAETTKAGITSEEALRRLVDELQACTALVLRGLMAIPDPDLDETATRRLYARIRRLHEALRAELALGTAFSELSLGMSHDFEWAVEEGATLVRVGTAIFGERA